MRKCWVCCKDVKHYILLPDENDYQNEKIEYKNSVEVIYAPPYKFLYYIYCDSCIDRYLSCYGYIFKFIQNRETTGKLNFS